MRALSAFACAAVLAVISFPAWAFGSCSSGRCATPPKTDGPGSTIPERVFPPAPPGWGHYMKQKLRDDRARPLAIDDELGGALLYRDRR
jgi:hypothetical protein